MIFYQLLDSDLGLEIKITDLFECLLTQERSLGVFRVTVSVWDYFLPVEFFFCLVTKIFFFLVGSSKISFDTLAH